jgi:hypothetical protein
LEVVYQSIFWDVLWRLRGKSFQDLSAITQDIRSVTRILLIAGVTGNTPRQSHQVPPLFRGEGTKVSGGLPRGKGAKENSSEIKNARRRRFVTAIVGLGEYL